MRARLRASGSSDSVKASRPAACWFCWPAQPPRAPSTTHARPAHAHQARAANAVLVVMMSSLLGGGNAARRDRLEHDRALPGDAFADARAVLDVAGELAAGSVDVVPSGFTHSGDDT